MGGHVHAECALLAHLDAIFYKEKDRQRKAELKTKLIPYIGISKRPCALCDMYIKVYNNTAQEEDLDPKVWAARTHGQMVPWRRPILMNTTRDDRIRAELHRRLVNKLWDKVDALARTSLSSQSTVSSGGNRHVVEPDDKGMYLIYV